LITDPLFYFVAVPAVLLAGISKGGFGGGLAMLGVPLLAMVISVPRAAAIMLPILCLMDLTGVWAYRKTWHALNLKIMAAGAFFGIAIGTATFHMFNDATIRILVGCVAVSFTLHHWLKRGGPSAATEPNTLKGMAWSAAAGFTSFIAHAGGPPANAYLLPQRMDKTLFVGTSIMVFTAINYTKLIPYWWLGLLPVGNLTMSLILAPLAPLGVVIGVWLHKRVSPVWFYRLCYLFLFASGLKLLYDGVSSLII
jgi:uncharacterized protein